MKEAIIFDIDGTLADITHRLPLLKDDWEAFYAACTNDLKKNFACWWLLCVKERDCEILFVTGRPEAYRGLTVEWLTEAGLWDADCKMFMRPDGDHRKDSIIKEEIYHRDIAPHHNVKLVLEDRKQCVDMWRSLGIETWQVAAGNF